MKYIKTFESYTKNRLIDLQNLAATIDMDYDVMLYRLEELGCMPEEIDAMVIQDDKLVLSVDPETNIPWENGEIHVLFNVNGNLPEDICFAITEDGGETYVRAYRSMFDLNADKNAITIDSVVESAKKETK